MEAAELALDSPAPRLKRISPAWFYALCVASFGIYLPVWIYRTVRDSGVGGPDKRAPAWWAAGSLCFPACAAILYEFHRHAARLRGEAPGMRVWVAPLLYAGIVAFATLGPWRSLTATLLLLPLPFLIAQRALERAEIARAGGVLTAPPRSLARWLLVAAGAPAAAAALWWSDAAEIRHLARPRLEAGRIVTSRDSGYSLQVPGDGWKAVENGTFGDENSDLEFASPSGDGWVVTYVNGGMTIDDVVDARRDILRGALRQMQVEERRTFLPNSDFVPVSHAVYRGSIAGGGDVYFSVATVAGDERSIEVVGFEPRDGEHPDLTRFVTSVSLSGSSP